MSENNYSIYQVNESEETWGIRFEPLERLRAAGGRVDRSNYDLVYAGPLGPGYGHNTKTLEALYMKFNAAHPLDFAGHSLSVSDVVVLRCDDRMAAYYADSFGFKEVPEFLDGPYRYYSTQRPVDIGTFPKMETGPEYIENYDKRVPVEDGRFEAWGALDYSAPLTEKQADDYELRAAYGNPDLYRYPPRQLDAQLQVVGRWEAEKHIPEAKRFVKWQADTGKFVMKNPSDRWPVNVRFRKILSEQERPVSIAAQLAEGAEQAAKNNAAHPDPSKDAGKER